MANTADLESADWKVLRVRDPPWAYGNALTMVS